MLQWSVRRPMRVATAAASVAATLTGGLALSAGVAYAAGSFTQPATNPVSIAQNSDGSIPSIAVAVTGMPAGQQIYIEVCDGVSPASRGYDITIHCDSGTSPPAKRADANGNASFPASSSLGVVTFHGNSPSGNFNCLAPDDVASTKSDGSVTPKGSQTTDGNQFIDTTVPSYTNCQIKAATSTAMNTQDQIFTTYTIANASGSPSPSVAESPLAVALPVGGVTLLGGGAYLVRRRRRNAR